MSKKKLLAGKKTKLAKHALTRALADKTPPVPESSPAPGSTSPTLTQLVEALRALHPELEQPVTPSEGMPTSQAFLPGVEYSYFHLLQDLRELQELLHPSQLPATLAKESEGRVFLPSPEVLQEIIRQTVATLEELKALWD
ncbi:MAG: hypothetical protein ACLFUU_03815 [Desulfobacteraceae bacterium]